MSTLDFVELGTWQVYSVIMIICSVYVVAGLDIWREERLKARVRTNEQAILCSHGNKKWAKCHPCALEAFPETSEAKEASNTCVTLYPKAAPGNPITLHPNASSDEVLLMLVGWLRGNKYIREKPRISSYPILKQTVLVLDFEHDRSDHASACDCMRCYQDRQRGES